MFPSHDQWGKNLGFEYEEKMFGKDFNTPDELYEAVGKQVRTMPQIIIDDKHIGGYNELGSSPLILPYHKIHN